ncbi:MAG: PrgI family protein [Clostridiales bacterium]|nr:PrgI family protein [Clostridiales bacterium]
MDIKINQEIRDYSEKLILGLNLREAVFCGAALIASGGIYFALDDTVHIEILSWLCVAGALPFVFLGFFKYHELHAEQIVFRIIMDTIQPRELTYTSTSIASELEKEVRKNAIKNSKKRFRSKKRKKEDI